MPITRTDATSSQHSAIGPDIEQDIYPFKGAKLSRADVEWLLTTHENERGPVDWNDESQREREGLDLRGADLRSVDLTGLPLAKTVGGLDRDDFADLSAEQLEAAVTHLESADLKDAHLQGANLSGAHLQEADLAFAHLEQADLLFTHLEGANLNAAYLEGANLFEAHLEQVALAFTHLEGVNLHSSHLEGADLCDAFFDINTSLGDIVLGDKVLGNVRLADVHWGGVNISNVDWSTINMLGDELIAREYKRTSNTNMRLDLYQMASRANRQLATVLREQGLNEDAARFSYRAQLLQRHILWFRMTQRQIKLRQRGQALGAWLFSWFLFLLAGYGYKPGRSFFVYLLAIVGFTVLYLRLDCHLAWYEAVVVSTTAFHGRGFSPSTFSPVDPLSIASAFEAFVGLIIEVTFIATLTQRFFNK